MRHNLAESRRKARRDLPCFSRHQWRERPSRNRGPRSLSTTRRVETIFMDKEHLSPADGLNLTHLVGLGCHLAPLTLQSMATKIPPEPLQPGRDKDLVAFGGLFGKGTRKLRALRDIAPTQPEQQPLAACAFVDSTCRCRLLLSGETEAMNKTRDPRLWNTAFPVSTQSLSKLSRVEKSACQHPLGS